MRDDSGMETGFRDVTIRPRGGQVLAAVVVLVCAIPVVDAALSASPALTLRVLPVAAFVAFGAVAVFWLPSVRVEPTAVVVRNVLRTTRVTWPVIEDVQTRWSLTLITARGRVTAWSAPRGSAVAAGRQVRRDFRAVRVGAVPQQDPAMAAGSVAASIVMRQWTEYRDAGLLGAVEGEGVEQRWHTVTIVALAALLVLALIAVVA